MDQDTRNVIAELKAVALNYIVRLEEAPISENSTPELRAQAITRVRALIDRANVELRKPAE